MRKICNYLDTMAWTIVVLTAIAPAGAQTLTISLTSHNVNFALTRGSASNLGSNPVSVTTNWAIGNRNLTLTVYSYFANSATALTGAGGNIPSSALSISV